MGEDDVTAFLTLVIAILTYLVWRVYIRIAWLTGAMETHSLLQVRLEASKAVSQSGQPVKVVWWDPDVEKPPVVPEHNKEAQLDQIYLYLPQHLRCNHNKLGRRLWRWFSGV